MNDEEILAILPPDVSRLVNHSGSIEKNSEAEKLKEEFGAATTLANQDWQKEIRALSDQLAFFKAELAGTDEIILTFSEKLKRLNELPRSSQT